MRSKLFFIAMSCVLAFTALFSVQLSASEGSVIWTYDYEAAIKESKASGKPILLFFTGSGWCGYCTKLEGEVFNTSEFAREAGDQFIFVKLDFNQRGEATHPQFKKQHSELKSRHSIRGYPTVIVIDGNERILMTTGYRQGGGVSYASHLQGVYARSGS